VQPLGADVHQQDRNSEWSGTGLRVWAEKGVRSLGVAREPLGPCIDLGFWAGLPLLSLRGSKGSRRNLAKARQSETVPERVRHWTLVELN
jgi:hypothetical protein